MPTSTGRGGAGNMSSNEAVATTTAKDLSTPTIKNATYTTGRGGSGNMAQNLPDLPEYARAAQDVHAPPQRFGGSQDDAAGSITYTGRGGGGNVLRNGERKSSFNTEKREREAREALRAEAIERDSKRSAQAEMSGAINSTAKTTTSPTATAASNQKKERRESASSIVGKGKELIDKMRSKSIDKKIAEE